MPRRELIWRASQALEFLSARYKCTSAEMLGMGPGEIPKFSLGWASDPDGPYTFWDLIAMLKEACPRPYCDVHDNVKAVYLVEGQSLCEPCWIGKVKIERVLNSTP